ncbi:MAG: crossover junction endodeoxyribonuclease RuvC [Rickettsiales bacterium]
MPIILGIDPGLQHTGWGVVAANGNHLSFIACGTIHPDTKKPMAERLYELNEGIKKVVELYKPQEAAVEETFVNKNSATSLKLGQARGAVLLSLALEGLPVAEYSANLVKKTVVGNGHADKGQVAMMVKTLLPASNAMSADAADALATAICHAHQRTFTEIAKRVAL